MNYNNYNNPYNQYPYTMYGANNYQPQYAQPQPQQMQTNYLPLTFVNGIEGAKAFIVGANQTVYLKDSDSNVLFEKRADSQGKYSIIAFELKQVELNNVGKNFYTDNTPKDNFVTKETLKEFQYKFENDLASLAKKLEELSQKGSE